MGILQESCSTGDSFSHPPLAMQLNRPRRGNHAGKGIHENVLVWSRYDRLCERFIAERSCVNGWRQLSNCRDARRIIVHRDNGAVECNERVSRRRIEYRRSDSRRPGICRNRLECRRVLDNTKSSHGWNGYAHLDDQRPVHDGWIHGDSGRVSCQPIESGVHVFSSMGRDQERLTQRDSWLMPNAR